MNLEFLDRAAPIIKSFKIFGMYGYKDVSLTCNTPVKIASADNGSGKTSLLTALYSIFAGQGAILYAVDFDSIEIGWGDGSITSYLKSELFGELVDGGIEEAASNVFFDQWGSNSRDEVVELLTKFILGDLDEAAQTRAFSTIHRDSPFDRQEIFQQLNSICTPLIQTGAFKELHAKAKEQLGDVAILYLPTYRRIEADLPEYRHKNPPVNQAALRKGRGPRDAWDSTRLIYFGMADVESKLNAIVTQIRRETLDAFSRNSGQTLEQLIDNKSLIESDGTKSFDLASIEVVLARVGKDSEELKSRLSEIIKTNEIFNENRRELRRFLSQLLRVYSERRDDEKAIENFVNMVNGYLCPAEEELLGSTREKKLMFDKLKLELSISNLITGKDIKFNNLSSGEKQVVSIFARLMLDPRKKYLILVDEPELSLSIEWQQRLLPDICATQNCMQLIAITHSPFVFDNELEVVSGTIDTAINRKKSGGG
ncbi:AAA family ATPase [Pseudoduganella sp. R-43]|uniref:AAA family ATPase n=1 Tax=Pseudoduganella sp. R-43 TaxID=3404063 RepID=UPI003CF74759